MKEIEVKIEKIAYGGWGLGRAEGKIIFIPHTIPGERVQVEIVREKKNYAEGVLREIKEASPLRQRPCCSLFGKCGGCHYQHLAYEEQLSIKEGMLKEFFSSLLRPEKPMEIRPIIPSPEDRGYRIRAQLKGVRRAGQQVLGFYEMKTHKIVEIKECPLLHPLANYFLSGVRNWLEKASELIVQNLEIQVSPDEDKGIICLQADGPNLERLIPELMAHFSNLKGLAVKGRKNLTLGELFLHYSFPGITCQKNFYLQGAYNSFVQINQRVNRELIKLVLDWAELRGEEDILDLFCGIGNFAIPLGQMARRVWGLDLSEPAIDMARRNAKANDLNNCVFLQGSAEERLVGLRRGIEKIDLIVLDPPRAGAGKKVLEQLIEFRPPKIIYVSCEPSTLVRDLKFLVERGFTLQKVQALDMFPHTYHLEAIACLER